jgi:hypothetical protein
LAPFKIKRRTQADNAAADNDHIGIIDKSGAFPV